VQQVAAEILKAVMPGDPAAQLAISQATVTNSDLEVLKTCMADPLRDLAGQLSSCRLGIYRTISEQKAQNKVWQKLNNNLD